MAQKRDSRPAPDKVVYIRLPQPLHEAIHALAKSDRRTTSSWVALQLERIVRDSTNNGEKK